jgi:hypothetical protein
MQKKIGRQLGSVHIDLMQWQIKKHTYLLKKLTFATSMLVSSLQNNSKKIRQQLPV